MEKKLCEIVINQAAEEMSILTSIHLNAGSRILSRSSWHIPNVIISENVQYHLHRSTWTGEVTLVSVLKTGLPGIEVPPGATITSRSAVRIRINF